ncbi:MAG: hypothetical protein E6J41_06470 [Chloroflexi bacterium]|nr:MAG: hypothetical protein E6J41_06470 [Chloroflexota bacterium]
MRPRELDHTPDLVELVSAARAAGHEVMLVERPMPDAVSVAGVGRRYDLVSTPGGAALEDAAGRRLDAEAGPDRLAAAARLWRRLAAREPGLVAIGGFAFDPARDPDGAWRGFPAVLFRVPELAVTRSRGRTFAAGDLALLDQPAAWEAPPARRFAIEPVRPEDDWMAAVAEAARRLRGGEAAKVVLAREVMARADGVVAAGRVARALRGAYPACFTYVIAGADGTAFAGASPELLLRRSGTTVTSQPMAGSTARGEDEAEDEALAAALVASAKDTAEHRVTARYVAEALGAACRSVEMTGPEIAEPARPGRLPPPHPRHQRRPGPGRPPADRRAGGHGAGLVHRRGGLDGRAGGRRAGHRHPVRPAVRGRRPPVRGERHDARLRPGRRAGGDAPQAAGPAGRARELTGYPARRVRVRMQTWWGEHL